jgi:hypothetical protein
MILIVLTRPPHAPAPSRELGERHLASIGDDRAGCGRPRRGHFGWHDPSDVMPKQDIIDRSPAGSPLDQRHSAPIRP